MKIEMFWCVVDPGPESVVVDICFEASPTDLVASIVGAHATSRERIQRYDTLAVYTDEVEAKGDAQRRLSVRDAKLAAGGVVLRVKDDDDEQSAYLKVIDYHEPEDEVFGSADEAFVFPSRDAAEWWLRGRAERARRPWPEYEIRPAPGR